MDKKVVGPRKKLYDIEKIVSAKIQNLLIRKTAAISI